MSWRIETGDCRETLASLEAGSVQTCVTSPPYFGLRDYGHDGQIGLEPTPDEFVAALVAVFREVRRVLRDDGTVWLNLGDSYSSGGRDYYADGAINGRARAHSSRPGMPEGVKPKDLLGIPWMVAFALRADGWYLRSDIIWAKPNPMPESVTDRPTKAHEYVFLLSKGPQYFYDASAIAEEGTNRAPGNVTHKHTTAYEAGDEFSRTKGGLLEVGARETRNRRSVWHVDEDEFAQFLRWKAEQESQKPDVWAVATQPFPGAHFATFPPKLIKPCILAGSREGDTVLDPFAGAGTTGMVALRHGRLFIGCELNPEYVELARERIIADAPLLNTVAEAAA